MLHVLPNQPGLMDRIVSTVVLVLAAGIIGYSLNLAVRAILALGRYLYDDTVSWSTAWHETPRRIRRWF